MFEDCNIKVSVEMERDRIQYGNSIIDYSLDYAVRKTLGIRVYPDKSVHVIAPNNTSREKIQEKVRSKASWVVRQQDFFLSFHPITPPRRFVSGETHMYLGKQYRLKLKESLSISVKLQGGNIIVSSKNISDPLVVEKLLKRWYKTKADSHFPALFNDILPLVNWYDGDPELKYRWMDKRWGSCSKNGEVLLNLELIKAPKKCIEYVIVHELCHLKHMNHSTDFYKLLESVYPDWKTTKDRLEKMMV